MTQLAIKLNLLKLSKMKCFYNFLCCNFGNKLLNQRALLKETKYKNTHQTKRKFLLYKIASSNLCVSKLK
ncbi:hypothetical protein Fmac_021511 [Flemingia macrophylla]|uniref:Uncharacterized protein n=1 Tax=Flemingia macrophylla TaxID=520843 RepID=A0ABD1LX29_9FABA